MQFKQEAKVRVQMATSASLRKKSRKKWPKIKNYLNIENKTQSKAKLAGRQLLP